MIAIYPGSFDPVTNGHLNLIHRASKLFPMLIVAVGNNPTKKSLFTTAERMQLIKDEISPADKIYVREVYGLLAHFCQDMQEETHADEVVIIRGLRAVTDFEFELALAQGNMSQVAGLETFFMPTMPSNSFISSSAAREIAKFNGNLAPFVPPRVAEALRCRYSHGGDPTV